MVMSTTAISSYGKCSIPRKRSMLRKWSILASEMETEGMEELISSHISESQV